MKEKRYFCDWVKRHEDIAFTQFWTGYGAIFLICMIALSKCFLTNVKAADIGGIVPYVIRWLAVIFLNIFITSLIVAFIIFWLCLVNENSKKRKDKDQELKRQK